MKKALKFSLIALGSVALAAGLLVGVIRTGAFNTRYDDMLRKYAGPPSTFVDIGQGVRVHVRDEGKGPIILMLHSSMTNLHLWDAWADELKKEYRVVRIDWPPYGLTIDKSGRTGTTHAADVVSGVVDKLGLDRLVLVGSSSGATLSVVYAAQHPEKVRALALSTLPLKAPPGLDMPPKMKALLWVRDNLTPNYQSRMFFRESLSTFYGDPRLLTEAQIDMFYDTNNLDGGYARVREYLASNVKNLWNTGAGSYAAKVKAPILLQWGDLDPVLPVYLVPEAVRDFSATTVTVKHYRQGHYPMLENPAETLPDLKAFLANLPDAKAERVRVSGASAHSGMGPVPK